MRRLPSTSRFVVAQRDDPEVARQVLDRKQKRPAPWRPAAAEWSPLHELMAKLYDRIGELIAVEASHPLPKGTKPKKPPKRHPRPLTGIEREEQARRHTYFDELVADVEQAQARYRELQANGGSGGEG